MISDTIGNQIRYPFVHSEETFGVSGKVNDGVTIRTRCVSFVSHLCQTPAAYQTLFHFTFRKNPTSQSNRKMATTAQQECDKLFEELRIILGKEPETGRQRTLNDPVAEGETETFPVKDLLDQLLDHPQLTDIEKLVEARLRHEFIESLKMTDEQCVEAEKADQRTPLWFRARFKRLTASCFGAAAGHSPFDKHAKSLLATLIWNIRFKGEIKACSYGIEMEPVSRDAYIAFMQKWRSDPNMSVIERNFFVNPNEPFLGYSPDGFVYSKKELMPTPEQLVKVDTWDPKTDPIQIEADSMRQPQALPFKKPRGKMSTCYDDNEHVDKAFIMEPLGEVFFDNETLEVVPFAQIPDECFGKIKKVYGKKFDNSKAPKTNWPSPPGKSKASIGTFC